MAGVLGSVAGVVASAAGALESELGVVAAVVFVHPNPSPDSSGHTPVLPDSLIDYPADTTRAIAHLHYSGTFARQFQVGARFAF